jgi:hypothetical protein
MNEITTFMHAQELVQLTQNDFKKKFHGKGDDGKGNFNGKGNDSKTSVSTRRKARENNMYQLPPPPIPSWKATVFQTSHLAQFILTPSIPGVNAMQIAVRVKLVGVITTSSHAIKPLLDCLHMWLSSLRLPLPLMRMCIVITSGWT